MLYSILEDLSRMYISSPNITFHSLKDLMSLLINFPVDRTPPMVTCPTDVTVEVDLGSGGRRVNWNEPTVSDNSGYFTLASNSHNPNDLLEVGLTVIAYVYTDAANNLNTCSFTVSIVEGKSRQKKGHTNVNLHARRKKGTRTCPLEPLGAPWSPWNPHPATR